MDLISRIDEMLKEIDKTVSAIDGCIYADPLATKPYEDALIQLATFKKKGKLFNEQLKLLAKNKNGKPNQIHP